MRITYSGASNIGGREGEEILLTGREHYAKLGQILGICSILAIAIPLAIIPLSIAAIILGFLGYHSAFRKQAVRAVVIGSVMLVTGMVLTITAAMILPYTAELMDMLAAGVPG